MGSPVASVLKHDHESRSSSDNSPFLVTNPSRVHGVYATKPEGMMVGDVISIKDGRTFVFCKNKGAAAIAASKHVTVSIDQYVIDGTNEVVIPTTDKDLVQLYLGASGTETTKEAMLGAYLGVVLGTGKGITRRIVGFEEYVYSLNGVNKTAYKLKLDFPLNDVLLDATSVMRIMGIVHEVTLYDAAAVHNALVILGSSAADGSVPQNSYFFVQMSGIGLTECDGDALVPGQEYRGADGTGTGDGNSELVITASLIPPLGTALMSIADGDSGFVTKNPVLFGSN